MGWAGSGPEFHVNFGSGWVVSLHVWVGLGRVKKIGPMSNYVPKRQRIRYFVMKMTLMKIKIVYYCEHGRT